MPSVNTFEQIEGGTYSLNDPPAKEKRDQVGDFVWKCFVLAAEEKKRLGLMERWKENYRLYRGDHWGNYKTRQNRGQVTVNLFFANVLRTVANITNKNPSVEVLDMDGSNDNADKALTAKIKKWWADTEQQEQLAYSTLNNEINGITVEKAIWNPKKREPDFSVLDPYSCFPAPGVFKDINDMPYFIHAYILPVDKIEAKYDVSGVQADNFEDLLGKEREDVRPNTNDPSSGGSSYTGASGDPSTSFIEAGVSGKGKALVVEMWYRDYSKSKVRQLEYDEYGDVITELSAEEVQNYPDGVRVTTVTNQGRLVLEDQINPNINQGLLDKVDTSYAWGRFPFFKANSYKDTTSVWGFSVAEQTGNLNKKIDELISRLLSWSQRAALPPLIVEKGCGISRSQINNKPGLVLMPLRSNARIEFLQVPELPQSFFNVLDILMNVHDRTYQIEDADRGVQPSGVTAASAIVALQERNAVLMQHKIREMDRLVRMRGRWAISFIQNFSIKEDFVEVGGEQQRFQGIELAGRSFNYTVESGSTVARTSLREEEQATQLYQMGAIDRQALLETLNFRGWRDIIERVGEGQLDQALQIMIQAGLPEDIAIELKQELMQPQGGPGNTGPSTQGQQPQPGTPKQKQGDMA